MNEEIFYNYKYIDPRTMIPFLIGKGSNKRMYIHLTETLENTCNPGKVKRIIELKKLGLEPIIEIIEEDGKRLEDLSEWLAFDLEVFYIKHYGRMDLGKGPLLNLTNGGEGPSGYKHTKEMKKELSKIGKERWLNEDYRKSQIEKMKKSWENEETQENHRKASLKMWEEEEYRKNHKEGVIKSWKSEEHRKNHKEGVKKIWENEEHRKNHKKGLIKSWENEETQENHRKASLKMWEDDDYRKNQSKVQKVKFLKMWEDENFKKKMSGENAHKAKLTEKNVLQIWMWYNEGKSITSISKFYDVHYKTITNIINRKTWKHIPR